MASSEEIMHALFDFQRQCNSNKRLRKMQRDWRKVIHYCATDTGDAFATTVVAGEITEVKEGREETPDVIVETDSETLCDMFWRDINPTQKYMRGEIKVKASQEDMTRMEAITAAIWPF